MYLDHSKNKDPIALLVLSVLVVVGFWPITTLNYSVVAGDMLDCWLSWYTFIGQCAAEGSFPTWNPFQQGGYPIYADLQGPAWFPGTYFLANTIGHSMYSMLSLVLLSLIAAGMGMYRLCRLFGADHNSALLFGAVYICSGFFLGHMMHLYAFMSGAWIVWIIYYLLRLIERPNRGDAIKASLLAFFQLTSGNHTFTIILVYLIAAVALVKLFTTPSTKIRSYLILLLSNGVIFIMLTVVLSFGVLYSYWEIAPYFSRGGGLSIEDAQYGSSISLSLYTFLYPLVAGASLQELHIETAVESLYIGAVGSVLLLSTLARTRTATENVMLVFGFICLMASFGPMLPVHGILFKILPGLDLFRFPGYFAFFTIVCWLPLAARSLSDIDALGEQKLKMIWGALFFIGLLSLLVAFLNRPTEGLADLTLFNEDFSLYHRFKFSTWSERIFVNSALLGSLFVLAVPLLYLRMKNRANAFRILAWIEIVLAMQLCIWNASVYDVPPSVINDSIAAAPQVPTRPDHSKMASHQDSTMVNPTLWRNTNNYLKRPSHDGFNSFWLKSHQSLEMDKSLLNKLEQRPLAFMSDGTLENTDSQGIQWQSFTHGGIELKIDNQEYSALTVQQSPYPGWHAEVNGALVAINTSFKSTMSVDIPNGISTVLFTFEKPFLKYIYLFSVALMVLICWYVFRSSLPYYRFQNALLGVIVVIAFFSILHELRKPQSELITESFHELSNELVQNHQHSDQLIIADVGDNQYIRTGIIKGDSEQFRLDEPASLPALAKALSESNKNECVFIWSDRKPMPEATALVASYFPEQVHVQQDGISGFEMRRRSSASLPTPTEILNYAVEYGPALMVDIDSLMNTEGKYVCFRTLVHADSFEKKYLAIAHEVDGRMLYYQAMPFAIFDEGKESAYVHAVVPKARLSNYRGELKVYIWNASVVKMSYSPIEPYSAELLH